MSKIDVMEFGHNRHVAVVLEVFTFNLSQSFLCLAAVCVFVCFFFSLMTIANSDAKLTNMSQAY